MQAPIKLRPVSGIYGVAKLAPEVDYPHWINGEGFSAAIRSSDELTIVCLQERIPGTVEAERGWRCFRSVGPISFGTTGVVSSMINPLADEGIGVFVICTFDGEHILVLDKDWSNALTLLKEAGFAFDLPQDFSSSVD